MSSPDRPSSPEPAPASGPGEAGERAKKTSTERLFFALWPDDELRHTIRRHCKPLLRHAGGRPMATENLHITLAFLGNTTAERRACVERTADAIHLPPFELCIDHAAHWPRPRVLWIGPSEQPQALLDLAGALHAGATACGMKLDSRPYRAHLTLMRKVSRPPAQMAIRPFAWPVDRFVLVRSRTLPEGVRYEVVREWPLDGGESS